MMKRVVPHAQKDIPIDIESILITNECTVCKSFGVLELRGISHKGIICVTNHQVLFITTRSRAEQVRRGIHAEKGAFVLDRMALGLIDSISNGQTTAPLHFSRDSIPELHIFSKDGRVWIFHFVSLEDTERIYHHIFTFAFPKTMTNLFAFYNRPNISAKKVIDLYPNEQESDDDDDPVDSQPSEKLLESVSEDFSSTLEKTDTETETDADWNEELELDTDFMMYDGWDVYDPKREYLRLGVRVNGKEQRKKLPRELREQLKRDPAFRNSPLFRSQWRLSKINRDYEFVPSYPRYLVVPRSLTDEEILACKNFRNQNRIPILSFIHPETFAAICRSAQVYHGFYGTINLADERYLEAIRQTGLNTSSKLYILDSRPIYTNGAYRGCEDLNRYSNCEYEFLGLPNTHKMRSLLHNVWDVCRDCQIRVETASRDDSITQIVLNCLEDARIQAWTKTISKILQATERVIELVQQGSSVLVHCPDGRDRTSLIVSLSMLQLDPFFRTIEGFEVLIEKEWTSAGHQFSRRYGHGVHNNGSRERAPVFVLFIDCVWQLLYQHPDAFEFNDEFLMYLAESLFSCRFGTFLCDCERDRKEADVYRKTCSLWSYSNCNPKFLNPRYRQLMQDNTAVKYAQVLLLKVASDVINIQFWLGYYIPHPLVVGLYSKYAERMRERQMTDEQLRQRVRELEEIQERLIQTIESFKKQNQELLKHNEQLYRQNVRLQKSLAKTQHENHSLPNPADSEALLQHPVPTSSQNEILGHIAQQ